MSGKSTVGKFEKEILEVFGIKVQVASPDDWVLALDGITLANLKNIKKNATKADMEELVAYKRKDKDCTEDLEVGNGAIDEETSTPDLYNVEPQDGYMFLIYDFQLIPMENFIHTFWKQYMIIIIMNLLERLFVII